MIETASLATFICYLIILIGIGLFFYKKTGNLEEYLIGGRKVGKWVTALSAQASDMSGWLLMGLPGAVYTKGLSVIWIAVGLFIGTFLNWHCISQKLRVLTQETDSITLPTFFERIFHDPTGLLRNVSAIITLFFFTIYASSGLVASGKLFESMFSIDYHAAVSIGTAVIMLYTFFGGFLAVSWTDFFQGTLMVIALVIVPLLAYNALDGMSSITNQIYANNISLHVFSMKGIVAFGVISNLAWGLGYFGQPHILARFMGIKDAKELPKAMTIAVIWVFISLISAVIVGLIGIVLIPGLTKGNEEKIFILMIQKVCNPWIGGIMLAAILSAIMSTIDSQLLVSSSTLTEDFYRKIIKREASDKELVFIGRLSVIIIAVIAFLLALNRSNTVLGLVAYAWGGFGAAFGPLVIFALFSKRTTWYAAFSGMITGTLAVIIWKHSGLSLYIYEIIPGFALNCLIMLIINIFYKRNE